MTQKEKDLLLRDLCSRLPYGVKCYIEFDDGKVFNERTITPVMIQDLKSHSFLSFKPYLRPMSSMTEEEKEEFENLLEGIVDGIERWDKPDMCEEYDWLNVHHFDYRGLIPLGLALPAKEGMYN